MKYTLDTDFSSLNGPKAANWIMGFQDMAEDAFADSSSHLRLLGNLLILEPYIHTLRQGLADTGRSVSDVCQEALDILWDYLEGKNAVSDFEDFANNLYAATLNYDVGEEITDAQAEFYEKHVDIPWGSTCESLRVHSPMLASRKLAPSVARLGRIPRSCEAGGKHPCGV